MKNTPRITTKISSWGNGYGIRLPKSFVEQISISPEHALELSMKDDTFIITKSKVEKKVLSKEYFRNALKKIKKMKNEDMHEINWGKPVGNEVW
jgi:antitoxin component of MazEF toxin-antitoxin module